MRIVMVAMLALAAIWGASRMPPAAAQTAPLPPCVDGQYGPGDAGVHCQVRGDTTPTAECNDGSFDYTRSLAACSGHGGVLYWLPAAPPPGGPVQGALPAVSGAPAAGEAAPAPSVARPASSCPTGTIPNPGNGGGPMLCADGSVSCSAGRGTCSDHGGIAPPTLLVDLVVPASCSGNGLPVSVTVTTLAGAPVAGATVAVSVALPGGRVDVGGFPLTDAGGQTATAVPTIPQQNATLIWTATASTGAGQHGSVSVACSA